MRVGSVLLLALSAAATSYALYDLPGKDWDLKEPEPEAQVTAEVLPDFETNSCAECHRTIAEEWATTRHAQAWVESVYREELKTIRKPAKCYPCHAPQPVLITGLGKRPKLRDEDPHFGVDCNTCHLGPDGAMHGPFESSTLAHASVKSELFTTLGSNELCITCHDRSVGPVIGIAGDFDDEDLGDEGFSCVGCHMQEVERPAASDPSTDEVSAIRKGRSHLLQTPRDPGFMRQAFRLQFMEKEGELGLSIGNRAGHRIPGLNDRILDFTVKALAEGGDELLNEKRSISREEALQIREELWIPLPEATKSVQIRGLHSAKSLTTSVTFIDQTLVRSD